VTNGGVFWSDRTFSILGYEPSTTPSIEVMLEQVHPDDVDSVRHAIDRTSGDRSDHGDRERSETVDAAVETARAPQAPGRLRGGEVEEVADAGEGLQRLDGELLQEVDRVAEPQGQATAQLEVVAAVRLLRDLLNDDYQAIRIDNAQEHGRVMDLIEHILPTLAPKVKLYSKPFPIFDEYGVQAEIDKALKSKVWLKSGGSIVINQTEALVAIDVNSGNFRADNNAEETAYQMNLLAAGPTEDVQSLAFSPNGKWLALGMQNGDVSVWNFVTRRLSYPFHEHIPRACRHASTPENDVHNMTPSLA
jgi:hypothetical protein